MNYFLPVHIGAPDYFNYLNKLSDYFNSIDNKNYNNDSSLELATIKNSTSNFHHIGPYIAGLFEGDGHIILSKVINSKGKISYPYIAITFFNKDLPLVNKFIELFGGRFRIKIKENAIVWIINTHKELVNLINLMNGSLRTPKITQFNDLILWLNDKYHYNIPVYSPDSSDLNNNGWLAGFIDADGGFKIRYTPSPSSYGPGPQDGEGEKRTDKYSNKVVTKGRIEVRFALEQRQSLPYNNQTYKEIMTKIQSFFGITTELKTSRHNIDKTYWIIEITSLNKLFLLIQYLNNYPLLTAKRNDYDDWLKVYHLMVNKAHLNDEGKLYIKNIKSNMNKNRTKFNFSHLIYLYNIQ